MNWEMVAYCFLGCFGALVVFGSFVFWFYLTYLEVFGKTKDNINRKDK